MSFLINFLKIPSDFTSPRDLLSFAVRCFFILFGGAALYSNIFGPAFEGGVKATASHILVKSEEECAKLKQEIESDAGGDLKGKFADVAKKHSTCPSKRSGGALGSFGRGQMVPEFDK